MSIYYLCAAPAEIAIGLGLSFEKVELELKVGNRGINFNHSYLFPGDRTEISLTGMYKL